MGIEFAYAAETAFVSPTLLAIGIDHKAMTMVWSLSPMLGFFLAPLMGSLSDRCTMKWGRRRPLILLLSVLIFCGLILVPWGRDIGSLLGSADVLPLTLTPFNGNDTLNALPVDGDDQHRTVPFHKWAAIVTILGTMALDFSADTCQTPARTYLLDTCISEDHSHGLSIFTVLAGLGGFMGYSLGGIDWESMAIGQFIGNNVKTVFTIVTVLFVISASITLCSFREIPLPLMEHDELLRPLSRTVVKREAERTRNGAGTSVFVIDGEAEPVTKSVTSLTLEKTSLPAVATVTTTVDESASMLLADKVQIVPANGAANKQLMLNNNGMVKVKVDDDGEEPHDAGSECDSDDSDDEDDKITLRQYLMSIVFMPRSMQILCVTNLLSWMAHLSYSLYFTDFVGESVFGGDPKVSGVE